jgi:hypothetical protein
LAWAAGDPEPDPGLGRASGRDPGRAVAVRGWATDSGRPDRVAQATGRECPSGVF